MIEQDDSFIVIRIEIKAKRQLQYPFLVSIRSSKNIRSYSTSELSFERNINIMTKENWQEETKATARGIRRRVLAHTINNNVDHK